MFVAGEVNLSGRNETREVLELNVGQAILVKMQPTRCAWTRRGGHQDA